MSRWIEHGSDGVIRQGIVSMDECQYLINEVCCNDKSPCCCDFPYEEECCAEGCPFFTKEDGAI